MKLSQFLLLLTIPFVLSCSTDDSNLTCNGNTATELSTLNIHFYDKDSSNLTSISIDTVLVTVNSANDTLVNSQNVSDISIRLSPSASQTSFIIFFDSLSASSTTLAVYYQYSAEFISKDCGFSNRFDLDSAIISNDSLSINKSKISVFENDEEHIHIFR